MGMYTGLRCKVKVKNKFREDIEQRMSGREWRWCDNENIYYFGSVSRSEFIPFGALSCMPDEWEYELNQDGFITYHATDGFENKFNKETGYWSFQCSLKNYDSTIEIFIKYVLNEIVEEVYHLEKYYEEWNTSELYELKDGKIVPLGYGIVYENFYGNKTEKDIEYKDFVFTNIEEVMF